MQCWWRLDGWLEGRMDGWMDGWTDGLIERRGGLTAGGEEWRTVL